ncbi:MAG: adenylate cyclase [Alteromonadaceae bacterium]|nr:MAG: adenylate cyclase [Alteromonadaceae bacterium]
MTPTVINTGNLEQGIDRHNLNVLKKRFLSINANRLERMRNALSERKRIFLDLLPLLFHTNHAMMPGFVSLNTPYGVSNYQPDKTELSLAKTLALSFTPSKLTPAKQQASIYGVYVMGSVGSIAQSERSDLDIWVCHAPDLPAEALNELNTKCLRLTKWAESLRLEAHLFPMNHQAFKEGQLCALDEESSGNTQRYLLLDEFYRTAIFLCGRTPLWWLVPCNEEVNYQQYADALIQKRFVPEKDVLDFGGIPEIPSSEFISAGIWQLYKAIESPYKSTLKLLLLEAYVNDYPNIRPLALVFKQQVYEDQNDLNLIDGYVMIFRCIERYLIEKQDPQRLELARRCFYFKVNKPLSKTAKGRKASWQHVLLESITGEWGWSKDYISFLDSRSQWKAPYVEEERRHLVRELNHSYRFLLNFASDLGVKKSLAPEELTILGRKLQAAFERSPGKVEWINPGISKDLSEASINIERTISPDGNASWSAAVTDKTENHSGTKQIKSSPSLSELLLWCYFNGIIDKTTQLNVKGDVTASIYQLKMLLTIFRTWLPEPHTQLAHKNFEQSAYIESTLILVNAEPNEPGDSDELRIHQLHDNADTLSYGNLEENLVYNVEMIARNSWGEITTRYYQELNALLAMICDYLYFYMPTFLGAKTSPNTDDTAKLPALNVACINKAHSTSINHRVTQWVQSIIQCFATSEHNGHQRYIFKIAQQLHCLQFRDRKKPTISNYHSVEELLQGLEVEQAQFSPIILDSHVLPRHALRCVAMNSQTNALDIFFRRFDLGVEIYLLDEKGSLSHIRLRGDRDYSPIRNLHRFLRAIITRRQATEHNFIADFGVYPINFFELVPNQNQGYIATPKAISTDNQQSSAIEIKAIAERNARGLIEYSYYCNEEEFSPSQYASKTQLHVAQHVLSKRKDKSHYPLYISDLDLSRCRDQFTQTGSLQTSHYFHEKNRLELQLNRAIGILLRA